VTLVLTLPLPLTFFSLREVESTGERDGGEGMQRMAGEREGGYGPRKVNSRSGATGT